MKVDECQNIINDFFAQTPRRHSKYEWELVRALFFLHTQKINPPGIYEGNSPEIFDAVTFSKVCEQAALDLRHARHRTQEISFGLNVIFV